MTKQKIIRVAAGLYRTEDGGYHIMRNYGAMNDRQSMSKWMVSFTNFFGEKVKRYFPTLERAKEYVNNRSEY